MKKKTKHGGPKSCSWREIRQTASQKVVTAHARRRIIKGLMRGSMIVVVLVAGVFGTYFGIEYWKSGVERVNTALPSQPLREIVVSTDGVLSHRWVEATLGLPKGVEVMTIDIHRKKLLLEEHGQVKSAVVRRLPDRLLIDVQERVPVVRLAARDETGEVLVHLVDREGVVYRGFGYDRHELDALPFVAGVRLHRSQNGFRPLEGMDQVDELLRTARYEMPHLSDVWHVVDCGDLPLIKIRSDDFKEIVFGPGRVGEQLRMLDMIVSSNRRQMLGKRDRVDLSLGNQVVVR